MLKRWAARRCALRGVTCDMVATLGWLSDCDSAGVCSGWNARRKPASPLMPARPLEAGVSFHAKGEPAPLDVADPECEFAPSALTLASAEYSSALENVWQLDDAGTFGWYGMVVMAPSDSGGCEYD